MDLAEAERLAREGWPLMEFTRRDHIALYEFSEALREALQCVITMLREERYYAGNYTGDLRTGRETPGEEV